MPIVALYERGPAWDDARTLGDQDAVAEHIDYMERLLREGVVTHAGPFHTATDMVDERLVGMVIFATGQMDEVRRVTQQDPAIDRGMMTVTHRPWYP